MNNCENKGSTKSPIPFRAQDARVYILLGIFFLCGAALGVYKQSALPCPIDDRIRAHVLAVLSATVVHPSLTKTAILAIAPSVICMVCAFTTFGAAIILPLIAFIGIIYGQSISLAYLYFSSTGLVALFIPALFIAVAVLGCTMFMGAQAIQASAELYKLSLGKLSAKLPVFDFGFYRRFASTLVVLLLCVVLYTNSFKFINSAVF